MSIFSEINIDTQYNTVSQKISQLNAEDDPYEEIVIDYVNEDAADDSSTFYFGYITILDPTTVAKVNEIKIASLQPVPVTRDK